MRLAVVAQGLHAGDALGVHVTALVRLLGEAGHRTSAFVVNPPSTPALEGLGHVEQVDLRSLIEAARDRAAHPFFHQDAYLFEYPTYSAILEAHRLVPGRPLIFHYHGIMNPELAGHPATRALLSRSIARLGLLEAADLVIVHSRFAANELVARVPTLTQERIVQIPIPVDAALAAPGSGTARAAARERLGVTDRFVILAVGRITPHKQVQALVDGLAAVRSQVPQATLMVIGEDAQHGYAATRSAALRRASELGCGNHVKFLGRVTAATLHDAYAAADVFATASRHEGFCAPIAEALTAGLPVVVADAGASPETAGPAALLFDPAVPASLAPHVLRLARDPEFRASRSQLARQEAARFTSAAVSGPLLAALDRVGRETAHRAAAAPAMLSAASALCVETPPATRPLHRKVLAWLANRTTLPLERSLIRPLESNLQLTASLAAAENELLHERINALEKRVSQLERLLSA